MVISNRLFFLSVMFVLGLVVLPGVAHAAWWNTSWAKSVTFTIPAGGVTETLTNFPVPVKVNSSRITTSLMKSDCSDVRFIASDGTTVLDYEIEVCSPSTNSVFWVEIPSITTSGATFTMYYNNTGASAGANPTGVWDSNYVGVYHFNNSVLDSTSSDEDFNLNNAAYSAGFFGGSLTTSGSTYAYRDGFDGLTRADAGRTYEFYISNPDLTQDNNDAFIGTGGADMGYTELRYISNRYSTFFHDGSERIAQGQTGLLNTWEYRTAKYSRVALVKHYNNGTEEASGATGSADLLNFGNDKFVIGCANDASRCGNMVFDEMRISKINRTVGWINATYFSMVETLFTYGAESNPPTAVNLTITHPANTTYVNALVNNLTILGTGADATYSCTQDVNGNVTTFTLTNNTQLVRGIVSQWNANKFNITCYSASALSNTTATVYYTSNDTAPTITLTHPANTTYTDYLTSNLTINVDGWKASYVCTQDVNGNVTVFTATDNTPLTRGIVSQWNTNKINITCLSEVNNGTITRYYTETET